MASSERPLVSVVVPVHNSSRTLKTCVDSLEDQDYDRVEVILVENGSTDDSPLQCRRFVNLYQNVSLLEIENANVTAARSAGIDASHGEYIAFCDADDWYKPHAISTLVRKAVKSQSSVVKAGYLRVINERIPLAKAKSYVDADTLIFRDNWTCNDYARFYNPLDYPFPSALWASLFSRELLQDIPPEIRENGLRRGEDILMNAAAFTSSKSVLYIPDRIYCYRYGGVTATNDNLVADLFKYKAYLDALFSDNPCKDADFEFALYCLKIIVRRFQNSAALSSAELLEFFRSCVDDPRLADLAQGIKAYPKSSTDDRELAQVFIGENPRDLLRYAKGKYRFGRMVAKAIYLIGRR